MSRKFFPLEVSKVVKETASANSLYFALNDDIKKHFKYLAGQYLTLKFVLNGEEYRRSYSICTGPMDAHIGVNVKRVHKGLISNHINENVQVGDVVEVMPPDGKFVINPAEHLQRDFYFFAAGSGITPIMAMIKTILEEEPKSNCYLLYGNKDEDNIIFKNQLQDLAKRYEGQFVLRHTLSKPKREKAGGLKGLFSKGKISWTGWTGRIDGRKIDKFLDENPPQSVEAHYYVCGPGAMIDTTLHHLESKGIKSDFLHKEHFVSIGGPNGSAGGGTSAQLQAHISGQSYSVEVSPDQTLLDALIDNGIDAPYSCTSGACSTCVAKVKKGDVEMDACYALDDDEVKAGYVLTCQARAKSSDIEVEFES